MSRLELCCLNMMSKSHIHLKFPIFLISKFSLVLVKFWFLSFFAIYLKVNMQQSPACITFKTEANILVFT